MARDETARVHSSIYISRAPCTELSVGYLLASFRNRGNPASLSRAVRSPGTSTLWVSGVHKEATAGPLDSSSAFPSSNPSHSPSRNWLQTGLLFQKINKDASNLGQKQRRITKELSFPVSKEESFLKTTSRLLQGSLPYKDDLPPKEVKVLAGRQSRRTHLSGISSALGLSEVPWNSSTRSEMC